MLPIRNILHAADFSEPSELAFRLATSRGRLPYLNARGSHSAPVFPRRKLLCCQCTALGTAGIVRAAS